MYITKTLESAIHDGSTFLTTQIAKKDLQEAIDTINALKGPDVVSILYSVQIAEGMTVARALECLEGIAAGTFDRSWLP